MFGLENASGVEGAALVVGVVLVEAILLYAGYGLLERVFGPSVVGALRGR
ncbi:DUF7512 family protein [Halobacterium jilantaiense]|uniref:Uncharacterized protein n=1 Tax=Halobacterium jilantaiense TaxID=355548 RepID=A0A1I0QRZ6_9EURY|nr:hypothetical protein [Halobacterium jilantaiense]SEW30353.1 hypothetical protein SAMN04487945_2917 [Halobacterium jilantaiense]